jgi:hypothetical protein
MSYTTFQLLVIAPLWAAASISTLTFNDNRHIWLMIGMSVWASGMYLAGLFVQLGRLP